MSVGLTSSALPGPTHGVSLGVMHAARTHAHARTHARTHVKCITVVNRLGLQSLDMCLMNHSALPSDGRTCLCPTAQRARELCLLCVCCMLLLPHASRSAPLTLCTPSVPVQMHLCFLISVSPSDTTQQSLACSGDCIIQRPELQGAGSGIPLDSTPPHHQHSARAEGHAQAAAVQGWQLPVLQAGVPAAPGRLVPVPSH